MLIVSSLIGIAMILMGIVWMLQGLNLAFRVGFMVGNYHPTSSANWKTTTEAIVTLTAKTA